MLSTGVAIQITTGIVLSMEYKTGSIIGTLDESYDVMENINREIKNGRVVRNMHSIGVTLIFIMIYIHIGKSIYYGSYMNKRKEIYRIGIIIEIMMIVIAFLGYSLPLGDQSYWAISVITNILTVIPIIGSRIVELIWGDYKINGITITRFYPLHYLLPLILLVVIYIHIISLHGTGGTNKLGININKSMINFNSMLTIKDGMTMIIYIILIVGISINGYEYMIEADNSKRYNSIVTPTRIVPHWYLLPYYTILRCYTIKYIGVYNMGFAILALLYIEILNMSYIKSNRLKPLNRIIYDIIVYIFIILMKLGSYPLENKYIKLSLISVLLYYTLIGIIMPIISTIENYLILK
jgi:ubiquinol-cytochrome c reductase cytochrome b subunit